MIVGTGIDTVELERIAGVLERHGARFLERVYTPAERDDSVSGGELKIERLAGKFAAKEATLKALGTGLASGICWLDVEVLREKSGAPRIRLGGRASAIALRAGIRAVHVSITHSGTQALAFVVAET